MSTEPAEFHWKLAQGAIAMRGTAYPVNVVEFAERVNFKVRRALGHTGSGPGVGRRPVAGGSNLI